MGNAFRKKRRVKGERDELYSIYQKICKTTHDKNVTDRLIESAKVNNPNKSLKWVYEKVLIDLERDNR